MLKFRTRSREGRPEKGAESNSSGAKVDKKGFLRRYGRFIRPHPLKKEHGAAYRLARNAFTVDRPVCPDCERAGRAGRLHPVADNPNSRRCDTCDLVITLHEIAASSSASGAYAPGARRAYFLRQATIYFVTACAVLALTCLYSAFSGSWTMFVWAFVMSAPLFMATIAMRYRAWQIEANRLFEVKAPFADFLRYELRAGGSKDGAS